MAAPSSGSWTVAELQAKFLRNEFCNSGVIRLHVVNYEAANEFPHKFMYPGCTGIVDDGRMCRRSVRHYRCKLHAEEAEVVDMLRFDLMVSDGSECGKPGKVTIFSPVADRFLDVSAKQMAALNEFDQIAVVERKIRVYPMLEVRFNVSAQGVVVQSFQRCCPSRIAEPVARSIIPMDPYGSSSSMSPSVKKPTMSVSQADMDNESLVQQATSLLRSLRFGSTTRRE